MKLNTIGKNQRIMHHLIQPRVLAYKLYSQSSRLFGGPNLTPLSWRMRARQWRENGSQGLWTDELV